MMRRCAFRACWAGIKIPPIQNEPMKNFAPGSDDRAGLEAAVARLRSRIAKGELDVPVVIDGVEHRPGKKLTREIPSDNKTIMHSYYHADRKLLQEAVESSIEASKQWSRMPMQHRTAVLLKAAQLLSTSWRYDFQAATMLNQSKNPWQAEIDSVAESIDFFRFNAKYVEDINARQPNSAPGTPWNMVQYRALEGFVFAISPFNFTAIGANLASAPALMGNGVVWKPSDNALYSAYLSYKLFEEAGMPKGVINFVPAAPEDANDVVLRHPSMAACVFTGSTAVFNKIQSEVGNNIANYRTYPRVTGETGGKNFHVIHPTAHMPSAVAGTVRSAFEYQGQKCSACSRVFVPKSAWPWVKEQLVDQISKIKQGGPENFDNFMCAVIDEVSFNKSSKYIQIAKDDPNCTVLAGGNPSSDKGWFVPPTLIETTSLECRLLKEEIFGPVLTAYVYDDSKPNAWEDICKAVDSGTKYGLTGSIWARDRSAIQVGQDLLMHASGMLYINDKSTGAVVGQQPFGGSRISGTNDKPGSAEFLMRFVSARTIKETLEHTPAVSYPHQLPDKNVVPERN